MYSMLKIVSIEEEKGKLMAGKTAMRLFNAMIDHVKKHGGKHWRADSIRDGRCWSTILRVSK